MSLLKQINKRSQGEGDPQLDEKASKEGAKFSQLKRGQTFKKSENGALYKKVTGSKAHKVEKPSNRKNRWSVDSDDVVYPVKEDTSNPDQDVVKIMLDDEDQTQKAFEVATAIGKRLGFDVIKESNTAICADVQPQTKHAKRLKNELESTMYSLSESEGDRGYLDPELTTVAKSKVFEEHGDVDLDEDQLSRLADYMHDVLSDGEAESKYEAAAIALDDIAGFEEHSEARDEAMNQMVAMYDRQYGEGGDSINESISVPISIKSDLMKTLAGDMTEKNAKDQIRKAIDRHFKVGNYDPSSKNKWETQMSGKQKEQFVQDFFHELKSEK